MPHQLAPNRKPRRHREWTKKVWAAAEELWIARDGQDSYYRRHVVIPGLTSLIVRLFGHGSFEIVDLGSGDGWCTQGLISRLRLFGLDVPLATLVDWSPVQIEVALSRLCLRAAIPVRVDFQSPDWAVHIPPARKPRVFVSVFVIQELPALGTFLAGLRRVMSETDLALALTVAPSYSELLKRQGSILDPMPCAPDDDWNWRGLYPIDGAVGRFYLPHFQRPENVYQQLFQAYGFRHVQTCYLSVPTNDQSISVFGKTVYGYGILGTWSSVIFALRPGLLRGKGFR